MNITEKKFGDLLCGMADSPAPVGIIMGEGFISLYFEINTRLNTLEKIEDGEIIFDGSIRARFKYSKGGDMVVTSRYYEEISKYAKIAEGAIKDLEYYFKISSND